MNISEECENLQLRFDEVSSFIEELVPKAQLLEGLSFAEAQSAVKEILEVCVFCRRDLEIIQDQSLGISRSLGEQSSNSSPNSSGVGAMTIWKLNAQDLDNFESSLGNMPKESKKDNSEYMGEIYGDRFAQEHLSYEPRLEPIAKYKSFPQGFDGVYYDSKTGSYVIAEFKGQGAGQTDAQKKFNWTSNVLNQMAEGTGVYGNASDDERSLALEILKDYQQGGELRYELIATKFNKKTGQFYTQLQERKRLSISGGFGERIFRGKVKPISE
jgi:hypothetical protein